MDTETVSKVVEIERYAASVKNSGVVMETDGNDVKITAPGFEQVKCTWDEWCEAVRILG